MAIIAPSRILEEGEGLDEVDWVVVVDLQLADDEAQDGVGRHGLRIDLFNLVDELWERLHLLLDLGCSLELAALPSQQGLRAVKTCKCVARLLHSLDILPHESVPDLLKRSQLGTSR